VRDVRALLDLAALDWSVFDREPAWDPDESPARGIRAGDALRRQVAAVRPDWPSARERRADAVHHLRVAALLDRVTPGRR
jgi:hypothetical protein